MDIIKIGQTYFGIRELGMLSKKCLAKVPLDRLRNAGMQKLTIMLQ